MLDNADLAPVFIANGELVAGKTTNMSQAYVMEALESEVDWTHIIVAAKATPILFINGGQDPSSDVATIAEYREAFPWIEIEVITDAGQLLIYQQFETVIPKLAAAKRA